MNDTEQLSQLREAVCVMLKAKNQYDFFVDGYSQGSASISEVRAAGDDYSKSLEAIQELVKPTKNL